MITNALSPLFSVDMSRLRKERLSKVQQAMAQREIGALILTNPLNIRYATDVSMMTIWTAINLARYAVVPVEGEPVLFEYGKALFLAKELLPKSRAAKYWQYRFSGENAVEAARVWADEIHGLLKEWGVSKSKVGIDILDCYGFNALKECGLHVVDADEPLEAAHLVKTLDEVALISKSCAIAETALHQFENAIRPGVTENELLAVFWKAMLEKGGEYSSCRLVASGERINPWFQESSDRVIRPGDLVGIDTDMAGPKGYLCDISRTFICGTTPNADQREAYRVSYDFIAGLVNECKPGVTYQDLMERAPRYPEAYESHAYSCMIHGDGMDDEPPFFPFPHDVAKGSKVPDGVLLPGMVLSIEFFAGKVGKRDGVKLEDQILITETGSQLLSAYPHDERLLS